MKEDLLYALGLASVFAVMGWVLPYLIGPVLLDDDVAPLAGDRVQLRLPEPGPARVEDHRQLRVPEQRREELEHRRRARRPDEELHPSRPRVLPHNPQRGRDAYGRVCRAGVSDSPRVQVSAAARSTPMPEA